MAAKYGQHFLVNEHAVVRIVDTLELTPSATVLEIGPGKGVLTRRLLEKAGHVVAVDVDEEMVTALKITFPNSPKLTIVHDDILKIKFESVAQGSSISVVGNLPYNLTSPILRRLAGWSGWDVAVVMVQKEVGDRLTAKVGTSDYGALTVGVHLTAEAKKVFDLGRTSFRPPPRVESSVIKLTRRAQALTNDIDRTTKVVQAAFQQRRKTIHNSLSHGLGIEKTELEKVLATLNIPPTTRAERLSPADFVKLSQILKFN